MKNEKILKNILLPILLVAGLAIYIFTIFDIIFDFGYTLFLILGDIIILVLLVISMFVIYFQKKTPSLAIKELEKSLTGGLFHYKCPVCGGIFAVKKSRGNDGVVTKMTCPDCGIIGHIQEKPDCVVEEIPEKKSVKANFRCRNCGEGVTIWAEGADLYSDPKVLICPFCKTKDPLQKL